MRKTPFLISIIFSACFDPGSAPLNCSADAPACPDSLVCIDGRCVSPIDDFAAPTVDMAGDLAVIGSGCTKGGGQKIGSSGAWLCPGVYGGANPKASALCTSGKICSDLALFSAQDCKSVSMGFFAATWGGSDTKINPQNESCQNRAYNPALFGCGVGDFETKIGCSGFRMTMQANAANKLTAVAPVMFDTFSNSEPSNGVICCP